MAERPARLVAHTPPPGSDDWHYLDDHLLAVAAKAASFAAPFGGQDLAWWAGIYHDLGKGSADFQDYLWNRHIDPDRKPATVDHKTAGAIEISSIGGDAMKQVLHGHHGGMSDIGDLAFKTNRFQHAHPELIELARANLESMNLISRIGSLANPPSIPAWCETSPLSLEFFLRMLFSSLVDADGLDTEAHWHREAHSIRIQPYPTLAELWHRFQKDHNAFVASERVTANRRSQVNLVRAEVYDTCLRAAEQPQGIFRLTVPTGGGKTRSGLAFALRHAVQHSLRRVVVAVPFLTITEQTAKVYREILGTDRAVLEHHSAVDSKPLDKDMDGAETPENTWRKLACENWDAPLIVTTTVQLFESLFSNKSSRCRKLHNLAHSVIVLDEAQTIPVDLRGPIFDGLRELVEHYGVTVVLSTATQPALDTIVDELMAVGREIVEIAPQPARLFASLERVRYEWPCAEETWSWSRVASEMRSAEQAMTIVNTIGDALTLYNELADDNALHLSTRMCGAHRREVLEEVRRRLHAGENCRLVSTQLVEAGVDLDFPMVMRAIGPLDRIVQAAGRCNREGRLDGLGQVVVFSAETDDRMPPGSYRRGAQETMALLRRGGLDVNDPDTFIQYFSLLYGGESADGRGIQPERRNRNYETVAEAFRMIDDYTIPVVVPYRLADERDGETQPRYSKVLEAFHHARQRNTSLRDLFRDVQPFVVNCNGYKKDTYEQQGSMVEIVPGLWQWKDEYDPQRGLGDQRLEPEGLFL